MLGPKTENDLKPSKGKVHKNILISSTYALWVMYVACVHVLVCCGQSAESAKHMTIHMIACE